MAPTVPGPQGRQRRRALRAADDVAQGKDLFIADCATCHGVAAQGTSRGPSLVGVGAASVDFQVGTGRMPLAGPNAGARTR